MPSSGITELIEWIDVTDRLPDDEITVLVEYVREDGTSEVWFGWHEGDRWFSADASRLTDVLFWAEMPVGAVEIVRKRVVDHLKDQLA